MEMRNKCCTYFKIVGSFDPDVISARLGITPDDCWKTGDCRRDGSLYGFSCWTWGRCDDYDVIVANQMRKTISGLLDKIEILNQIRNDFDVSFCLEVVPEIYVDADDVMKYSHIEWTEWTVE